MTPLEHTDELGLPWDRWADGRPHVLLRGKDFYRGSAAVQEAARNAARRLNKAVSTVKEHRVGKTYLWVQFSDFEVDWGDPCPSCGGADLRLVNRRHTRCTSCGATVALIQPKRHKELNDATPGTVDPVEALLRPLLGLGAAGGSDRTDPGPMTGTELHRLFERTKSELPREETRRWGRRSFNEVAAIIAAGAFSSSGAPVAGFDVVDDLEVCVLLELSVKNVDVRVGVVLGDVSGAARYRVVLVDPPRLARPGRYVFRVTIPGGIVVPDAYVARVSAAFVRGGEFSRVTLRGAFSLDAFGEPPASDVGEAPDVVELDDLDWAVVQGEGPWALSARGGTDDRA